MPGSPPHTVSLPIGHPHVWGGGGAASESRVAVANPPRNPPPPQCREQLGGGGLHLWQVVQLGRDCCRPGRGSQGAGRRVVLGRQLPGVQRIY